MIDNSAIFQMFKMLADASHEVVFITSFSLERRDFIKTNYCNKAFEVFFEKSAFDTNEKDVFDILNIQNEKIKNKLEDLLFKGDSAKQFDLFVGINLHEKKWINFDIQTFVENNIQFNIWKQNDYNTDATFKYELDSIENSINNVKLKIEDGLDPICFVDFKGKLLFANNILLRALEYEAHELFSVGILNIHEQSFRDIAVDAFYSTREGIHQNYNVTLETKTGSQLSYLVSTFPYSVDGKIAGVYYHGKETTSIEILLTSERLSTEINSMLAKNQSFSKNMNAVAKLLSEATGYDCVEVWLPDKSFSKSSLFAHCYPDEHPFQEFYSISSTLQLNLNEDDVLITRKGNDISRKVTNLFLEDNFPRKNWAQKAGLKEGISLPIYWDDKLVAHFTFFSKQSLLNFHSVFQLIKLVTNKIALNIQYIKQNNELNQIFNLSPDFLCIIDISGKFINANNTFCNQFKISNNDLFGKSFVSFVDEEKYDFINDKLIELKITKLVRFECEFKNPALTDKVISLEWSLSLDSEESIVYCAAKDITQKKEYEKRLKVSNDRYILLSKATNDVIYEWDVESNVIQWNESFSKVFGHHLTGLTSDYSYWTSFLHPAEENRVKGNFNSAKMNMDTKLVSEYKFRAFDGNYRNILDRGILIYDENNQLIKMVGSMQDITLLKESEITLEHLNNALQHRARQLQDLNKELEQFAYIVSHDLQEPLRMISSFMQLLLNENEHAKTEKSDLYINFAIDGANRMKRLIQDLLTYSRVGATEEDFVEIDCNLVLKETLQVYNQRIVDLKAEVFTTQLPKIKAIHSLIGQVFDNLVSNALKYNDKSFPVLEISYEESPTHFILKFKDNGIGIDARYTDLVFMPFKRLHKSNEYSGTGIGLAVVKKIAEKHNGQLWLESIPKIGSTFFISFKK